MTTPRNRASAILFAAAVSTAYPASSQTEPPYGVHVRHDVMVSMRDGVRLAADLYLPVGAAKRLPVIVERSPYNKATVRGGSPEGRWLARQGFAVLVQDVRGQYASEGGYTVEVADAADGYDTIEWAARQPWSNGRVGTFGCSYAGEVQYLTAKLRPPHLRAIWASAAGGALGPAGEFYSDFGAYDGGALTLSGMFGWFTNSGSKARPPGYPSPDSIDFAGILGSLPVVDMARKAGLPPNDWVDFVTHPTADPYWERMRYLRDDDRFDVPAVHEGFWLDPGPERTLYEFNLVRRNATSARARGNQFAIMSPTPHCVVPDKDARTVVGERDVGDARYPAINQVVFDWFGHWLKGVNNGVTNRPRVLYYVTGLGEWRTSPVWPVQGMRLVPYYLSSTTGASAGGGDGTLDSTPPARAALDRFGYDPADPFPSRGGRICCTGN